MAVLEITKDNFTQQVLESDRPVLVDFWAAWCGPCQMQGPIVDKVAEKMNNIKVGKVNVDEEQELSIEFNVKTIPTLVVFKDGKEVNRSVGLVSMDEIEKLVNG